MNDFNGVELNIGDEIIVAAIETYCDMTVGETQYPSFRKGKITRIASDAKYIEPIFYTYITEVGVELRSSAYPNKVIKI